MRAGVNSIFSRLGCAVHILTHFEMVHLPGSLFLTPELECRLESPLNLMHARLQVQNGGSEIQN